MRQTLYLFNLKIKVCWETEALTSLLFGIGTDFSELSRIFNGLLHVGEDFSSQMNPKFTSIMQMAGDVLGVMSVSTLLRIWDGICH